MSLTEISHYSVQLFGTNRYDGITTSIFKVRTGETPIDTPKMLELSVQSKYQYNMFVTRMDGDPNAGPAYEDCGGHRYLLRCFSRTNEIAVPPLWAFGASPVVLHDARQQDTKQPVFIVEGHADQQSAIRLTDVKGFIQRAAVPLENQSQYHHKRTVSLPGGSADPQVHERIVLTNILGRPQSRTWPDIQIEYITSHRTFVIYDAKMTPGALQALKPTPASLTRLAVEQLNIDTVVVCVQHSTTGGIFARAFLPMQAYAAAPMPVAALPYLRHPWGPLSVKNMFEILWVSDNKACRIIKSSSRSSDAGIAVGNGGNDAQHVELLVRSEPTLTRTFYL
ncbi:hypothetical protein GGH99_001906 [Coemansia sp. RSA 1285]|nr:hypothetical protein GGH99_001906 [Coemansia sp. RSA 1285]